MNPTQPVNDVMMKSIDGIGSDKLSVPTATNKVGTKIPPLINNDTPIKNGSSNSGSSTTNNTNSTIPKTISDAMVCKIPRTKIMQTHRRVQNILV